MYAANDPVNRVDPSGKASAQAYCIGAAAAAAALVIIPLVLSLITGGASLSLIFFALAILPYDSSFVVSLAIACLGGVIGGIVQDAIG